MNHRRSFSAAPNAATHSESTHKHYAFTNRILEVALKLRKRGYSDSYLTNMVRALKEIAKKLKNPRLRKIRLYDFRRNMLQF